MWVVIVLFLAVLGVAAFAMMRPEPSGEVAATAPAATKEPTAPVRKLHWLVGRTGEVEGKSFHIGQRKVTVGRAPSNFVQLNSPQASRQQCQLFAEGETMTIVDMTSSNGTVINGRPVEKHTLVTGDVLTIGDSELVYHFEGDFGTNAAWDPKEAGSEVRNTTKALSAGQARRLAQAATLYEQHGEARIGEAAAEMDISVDEFRELLEI